MTKTKRKVPAPTLSEGFTLIDTHCHLDMSAYSADCDQVVARAIEAGVEQIITVGIDLKSSRQAVTLAQKYEAVMATVGVHPHNVSDLHDAIYDELRALAASPKVVAYGEIGMDSVKRYAPLELQMEHFERQVGLAKELNLPLVIHDREAHDEILGILQKMAPFPGKGVMHCFSGDAKLARDLIDLGFYISVPGIVTFNKADVLQDAVKEVPLKYLMLETDGPFLAPVPRRGKRNEPALMLYTAQKVAEIKGLSLDEVAGRPLPNAPRTPDKISHTSKAAQSRTPGR